MPLYEYKCYVCEHRLQQVEPFTAPSKRPCPKLNCQGIMSRIIGCPAIKFKGPGFHVNDYPSKGR